ncbi:GNAT family N-acetyltransferase [Bounagaea algeriensis]
MTAQFFFRRPIAADLSEVLRVHGDPRTNVHNPAGPDDEAASRTRLAEWMQHWQRHGFGYEVIGDAAGAVLGFAGVRQPTTKPVPCASTPRSRRSR